MYSHKQVYNRVAEVKQRLAAIRFELPIIQGRNGAFGTHGRVDEIEVGDTPAITIENIVAPYLRDPVFLDFASWFVYCAFDIAGESGPKKLSSACGVVGPSGQLLDYLHIDPMLFRVTTTITDADVNPSTIVCKPHEYDEDLWRATTPLLEVTAAADIPCHLLLPQVEEGGLVTLYRNQAHAEKNLPQNAAKIAMFATF